MNLQSMDIQESNEDKLIRLKEILAKPSEQRTKKELYDLTDLIVGIKFLEEFRYTDKLIEIARHMFLVTFPWKHTIFSEGDQGDCFYIILKGKVTVYVTLINKESGSKTLTPVAELKSGDSFGELALLYGGKRAATCVTVEESNCIVLARQLYDKIVRGKQTEEIELITDFFVTVKHFRGLSRDNLYTLASRCQLIKATTNTIIVKQGTQSPGIYIIKSGQIRIMRRVPLKKIQTFSSFPYSLRNPSDEDMQLGKVEEKLIEIGSMGLGDSFGEPEAFSSTPFTYNVISAMPCNIYMIPTVECRFLPEEFITRILNSSFMAPTDEELRISFRHECKWSKYKDSLVSSLRTEKAFHRQFNFRLPPIKSHKTRCISPENVFKKPNTHMKSSPLSKQIPYKDYLKFF